MFLSHLLSRWRRKRRLSQEALARELGISVITISRWERGEVIPSPLASERFRQAFHEAAELFTDDWFDPRTRRCPKCGKMVRIIKDHEGRTLQYKCSSCRWISNRLP